MPQCIPTGQLTLHLFGQRKRHPITATFTGGAILNNSFGLFLQPFLEGFACDFNSRTCGGSTRETIVRLTRPYLKGRTPTYDISFLFFSLSGCNIEVVGTITGWRWRQVRTYGHSNLRWWPWTTRHQATSTSPRLHLTYNAQA